MRDAARESRERPAADADVPASLAPLVRGRAWARDLVGEAGSAVYRLHQLRRGASPRRPDPAVGADDLFLKHGRGPVAADVLDEAVRLRWLAAHVPVPAVRHLVVTAGSAEAPGAGDDAGGHVDEAWLLTDALPGRTAYQLLEACTADPGGQGAVVDALAAFLRRLHAVPAVFCPFTSDHRLRLAEARARLEAGLVDVDDFGAAHRGWSARRVWDAMTALLPFTPDPVVTHGDFSLDNVLLAGGEGTDGAAGGVTVVGCLDVGRAGVADRYQDLAILWDCLGEFDAALQRRLFAGYGVTSPDERKLRFHLALDEFF